MLNADVQPHERGSSDGRLEADSWIYGCWEADDQPVVCHLSPAASLIVLQTPGESRINEWKPPVSPLPWMNICGYWHVGVNPVMVHVVPCFTLSP